MVCAFELSGGSREGYLRNWRNFRGRPNVSCNKTTRGQEAITKTQPTNCFLPFNTQIVRRGTFQNNSYFAAVT